MKKRVYNFNLPDELRDYLKERSKKKHTTMSGYLINLIEQDKKDLEEFFIIKESTSIEGAIVKAVAQKAIMEDIFDPFSEETIEIIEKKISERMDEFIKMEYKIDLIEIEAESKWSWDKEINGKIFFKSEKMDDFKCLNISLLDTAKSFLKDE